MKLSDVIILSVIISIFSPLFARSISLIRKMDFCIEDLQAQQTSITFISESFYETCQEEGRGFDSLEEWKISCKLLWSLESIEVKEEKNLLSGKWSGPSGKGEVYYRKKTKD